jgi:hypothetical protein
LLQKNKGTERISSNQTRSEKEKKEEEEEEQKQEGRRNRLHIEQCRDRGNNSNQQAKRHHYENNTNEDVSTRQRGGGERYPNKNNQTYRREEWEGPSKAEQNKVGNWPRICFSTVSTNEKWGIPQIWQRRRE